MSYKNIKLEENCIYNPPEDFEQDFPRTFQEFKRKLKIDVKYVKKDEIEFDLIGVPTAVANAFRRILLAEVPTMAIDKVFLYNNTSIIQDEVLAHRIGLIPIYADPRLFDLPDRSVKEKPSDDDGAITGDPKTTLAFELNIRCSKISNAPQNSSDLNELYRNHNVYSKHLKWIPLEGQAEKFKFDPPRPVLPDILIAKLRQGHEISLLAHCYKGIGKDHAKFSPVATATYRLLPSIKLLKPVEGENAEKLQQCFSPGVIEVERVIRRNDVVSVAKVVNPRIDTCSREVFNHSELKDLVEMSREKNHFIFTIESTGALTAVDLFSEAAKILVSKCTTLLQSLSEDLPMKV